MGVAGELSTIGLAEVFQNLAFNHLSGTLTLTHGQNKAHVAFEDGRIRAVAFSDRKVDYAEAARRSGLVNDELLAQATNGKRRRTLKAFLRASGPLEEEAYDAAITMQVEEELLPLFGWSGAFTFEEGPFSDRRFDKEQRDCGIDLDPMGVAMEAARRHDEWQGLAPYIPSEKEILVMPAGRPDDIEESAHRLLDLIDGTRPLGEIIKKARVKKYDALRIIGQLVELGWLQPATPTLLRDLAAKAKATGEINLAAQRLEVARESDPSDLDVRRDLVHVYERAERKNDAARELVAVAAELQRRGDLQQAHEAFDRAAVLAPRDLDVLEQVFEFHVTRGDKSRAVRAGRRLAETLAAQGMHEDARPLYERLLREHRDHEGLRESLAHCLIELEDMAGAVEHLQWIAERTYERGEFDGALRRLRRILELDEENEQAKELVHQIESGAAEKRLRRRRRRLIAACLAPILGLACWQVAREYNGVAGLHAAQYASVGKLALDNTDGARLAAMERYAKVCTDHPFTRSEVLARETLRTLLVSEVGRVRELCTKADDAKSLAEVEYTLGRAEKLVDSLDSLTLPGELKAFWKSARTSLRAKMQTLRKDHDGDLRGSPDTRKPGG
jgi:tetratricopeptide (TPR) repeat protein